MTISSTIRKAGPFTGTGSASTFPFDFKVFSADDLQVVRADFVGNETVLTLDADYSASINANQDVDPGGQITLLAGPLAIGSTLVVTSGIAQLQGTDLTNAGGFYPEVITAALDLLTILVQQLQIDVGRALKYSVTDPQSADLPNAASRANKFLYFGADGSLSPVSVVVPSGAVQFAGPLTGARDGVNKIFNLTNNGSPIGKTFPR